MSGHKCSEFHLQQEQEKKLQLVQNIGNLQPEVGKLNKYITDLLAGTSAGLRATFAKDVQRATNWLNQTKLPQVEIFDMDMDLAVLRATHSSLAQVAGEGRKIHEDLSVDFTQKANQMGQDPDPPGSPTRSVLS